MQNIKPSATLSISAAANELKAQGHDIVSLSAGEPDFTTPEEICQAGIMAIKQGHTHYTAVNGTASLRNAITKKLKRDNQLTYSENDIIVSNGAKQSIFNAIAATINPGDEVIITSPYWVSYPDMVELNEGVPVICKPENGIKPTAADIEGKITDKTKMLILNSPNNPGGYKLSREALGAIGDLIKKHPNIIVLSDDIYEYLSWTEEPFHNILNTTPELQDRTIIINGASKGYAMTGWRIGYSACSNQDINKAMKTFQSQTTSCPSAISQFAATTAMGLEPSHLKPMLDKYRTRHQILYEGLNAINGMEVIACEGAFYSFPNCSGFIKRLGLKDDMELAKMLLEKVHLAVVPGTAFGTEGHIRLSFACSEENIKEALKRLNAL